jgi:outer membrane receptor protein involved in Fe transport
VLDLGLRWHVRPNLIIDGRVDNILDEVYADSGSITQWLLGPPRSPAVSLNVLF